MADYRWLTRIDSEGDYRWDHAIGGTDPAPDPVTGTLGASLQALEIVLEGVSLGDIPGTLGASLQPLTVALGGIASPPVDMTLGASLQPLSLALDAHVINPVDIVLGASLQALTLSLSGDVTEGPDSVITLGTSFQALTFSGEIHVINPVEITLGTSLQALGFSAEGRVLPPAPDGFLLLWDGSLGDWVEIQVAAEGGLSQTRSRLASATRGYGRELARHATIQRNRRRHVQLASPTEDREDAVALVTQLRKPRVRFLTGDAVDGSVVEVIITGVRLRQTETPEAARVEYLVSIRGNG